MQQNAAHPMYLRVESRNHILHLLASILGYGVMANIATSHEVDMDIHRVRRSSGFNSLYPNVLPIPNFVSVGNLRVISS